MKTQRFGCLLLVSLFTVGFLSSLFAQPEMLVPGAAPFDMDVEGGILGWTELPVEACPPPFTLNFVDIGWPNVTPILSGCDVHATSFRKANSTFFFFDAKDNTLKKVSRWSGSQPQLLAPAPGSATSGIGNLAVRGAYVYWGDDGGVHRTPQYSGSAPVQTLVIAPVGYHNPYYWITVDDAYVYYVTGSTGNRTISRVPINGGSATPLITSLQSPGYLAVDDLYLYWADAGARIFRMPKGGGSWTSYNAADSSYQATGLVVDDTYIYWSQSGPPLTDSVILRRSIKNGNTTSDILIGRNAGYLRQDYFYLYWRDNEGIKRLRKDSGAISMDFRLPAIEVTQGIQNLANSVPLVGDKPTFVRVYPGATMSGPARQSLTAVLRGTRAGVPLPGSPLTPLRRNLTVDNGAGIDRNTVSNSFVFVLPPAWLSNSIVLTAEVNPYRTLPETSFANNTISVTNTFTRKAAVGVYVLPVTTRDLPDSVFSFRDPRLRQVVRRFATLYPTAHVFTRPLGGVTGPWNLPGDKDWLMVSLIANYLLSAEFNDGAGGPGDKNHVMGMVSPDASTGDLLGYANFCVPMSFVKMVSEGPAESSFTVPSGGATMAQEIAHNYNGWPDWPTDNKRWQHVACGTTNGINPAYPYPPGQIGTPGTNSNYGFDPISLTAIAPESVADFMSYCRPAWVSDYNWRGLFYNLPDSSAASAPVSPMADYTRKSFAGGDVLFVCGVMMGDGSVHWLGPSYRFNPAMLDAQRLAEFQKAQAQYTFAGANYSLDQVDGAGNILSSQPFEPFPGEEHDDALPTRAFCLALPFDSSTAKVRVSLHGEPMATMAVSPNAPTVNVTEPKTGTYAIPFAISWSGKDADDDLLSYSVQFSADGGTTWQLLGYNLTSQSMTQEVAALPGSTNCYVRVIASDGVNTASGLSPRFSIAPHAPVPFIDGPADQQVFWEGDQIIFDGDGYDMEDGMLPDDALRWYVDALGYVGSGRHVTVPGLAPGVYQVRLDVVDTDKNLVSASVKIIVSATGERPRLTISPGSKDLLLSWPYSAEDYVLEWADHVNAPKWSALGSPPILIGEQNTASVGLVNSNRFYRLRNSKFP